MPCLEGCFASWNDLDLVARCDSMEKPERAGWEALGLSLHLSEGVFWPQKGQNALT